MITGVDRLKGSSDVTLAIEPRETECYKELQAQLRPLLPLSATDPITVHQCMLILSHAHWLDGSELSDAGVLNPVVWSDRLMWLSELDLSLARLVEGHLNALQLCLRLGSPSLREFIRESLAYGQMILGVWGVDSTDPVSLCSTGLSGVKNYTSGLGVVTHALVTADIAGRTQLCLVDARDSNRHDLSSWNMRGMRATRSGSFNTTGLEATEFKHVGDADDFGQEPGLVTGVWRIAALQLGASFGLLDATRQQLQRAGRADASSQIERMLPPMYQALAARSLVEHAAIVAERATGDHDVEAMVALSLCARLLTEDLGQLVIASVERSMGLSFFSNDSRPGHQAADLATYMRQVARDAFAQRAGTVLMHYPHRLARFIDG